jgi:hypothetical protein
VRWKMRSKTLARKPADGQDADDFVRRVSLLFHVRFLAFQFGTPHSIRTSFTGLDQFD